MSKLTPRDMALVAMFASLAVVAALLFRFFGGMIVPFSLMPFVALLAGGLLGARLGALSMGIYVLMGVLGLPVFEKPPYGGPAYILSPTFGFLLGFILAALVTGLVLHGRTDAGPVRLSLAMLAGLAMIWVVGLPYLYVILNFYMGQSYDLAKIITLFFVPFIGFDLLKVLAAGVLIRAVGARLPVLRAQGN
ncbi:biotin transporter BioY [Desulfallas thermosapovorans]|uniref:Biotin transporter n=1 Tax=Desulfallas thermosapovorans DSM 6562 TaxID=1121431 RepID=A0A5S4ZPW1_9FIRM|nr:biotin transporter BioY [Desulfallas thermosapovorans]TYO94616.1 biotin transport system substrate-specific component [Desulfallas thermosapovorans DSM 6562]